MALKPIIAAAALLVSACASMPAQSAKAPQPAKPVDAAKFYTGVWREIGRRPMKLTDGCIAGATAYKPLDNGTIQVRDTCLKGSLSGKEEVIGGPAKITDPGFNAKLHVSYRLFGFVPIGRDYWVLDHDDAYTWFISSDPAFENLWIYTRDPKVGPAEIQRLTARAQALGYDVSKLEFPQQP